MKDELIRKLKESIDFYSKIIGDNAVFLSIHGITASEKDIAKGKRIKEEIAALEKQIEQEGKTDEDSDKELFHLCQYSEGVCVWCGHIMGLDDEGRIDPEADKQAFGSGWETIK